MSDNLKRILLFGLFFIVGIIALPLLFPLLIGGVVSTRINSNQFKKRYASFINSCDDLLFFCYSDRKNRQDYIQKYILTHLDASLNVVYLRGRQPHSEFDDRYIAHMLDNVTNKGCPTLLRITNGRVIDIPLEEEYLRNADLEDGPTIFVQYVHTKVDEIRQSVES